jgi:hypothetical protein
LKASKKASTELLAVLWFKPYFKFLL